MSYVLRVVRAAATASQSALVLGVKTRSALLAILVAILFAPSSAHAGAVTVPNGGTHSVLQALLVKWNGIGASTGTPGVVTIEMTIIGSSVIIVPLAPNIANSGQYTFSPNSLRNMVCTLLPMAFEVDQAAPFVSGPYPVNQMHFYLGVRSTSPGGNFAQSSAFRMECPHKIVPTTEVHVLNGKIPLPVTEFGSLHIYKSVGYTGGGGAALVPASFAMIVNCTPSGPTNQPVTVPTTVAGLTLGHIADGSVCTVTEPPLPLVNVPSVCGGNVAHWERGVPGPVTITANATTNVTVTNWIACGRPRGWIGVTKNVINSTGAAIPSTFTVGAHCIEPSGTTNVSFALQPSVGQWHAFGVDAGGSCTLSEAALPPISHVKGCGGGTASWSTSYAPAQVAASVENVMTNIVVTNTLACDLSAPFGHLTISKTVVNSTGGAATMPLSFSIVAHCSPSGPLNIPLTVPSNDSVSVAAALAAGSVCTATEQQPPSIPFVRGCKGRSASWTKYVSAPVTIAAGMTSTITVRNVLTCDKPTETGSLTIFKKVIGDGPIPPPDVTFYVDVNCLPGGPNETVKLNGANDFHDTVNGVVVGGTCTIGEQQPTVAPDLLRRGCHWDVSYPDERHIAVSSRSGARLTVVNRWTCKEGSKPGEGTTPPTPTVPPTPPKANSEGPAKSDDEYGSGPNKP